MKTFKHYTYLFTIISFFIQGTVSFSQDDTTLYIKNPDKYVAEQLLNKRIVMLGDFMHHAAVSNYTVLYILNEWLKLVNNSDAKCNLTLILECTGKNAETIGNYIKNGDLKPFYYMFLGGGHLEDLDYFSKLKSFTEKLHQSKAYNENRISFKIKGFEEIGWGTYSGKLRFKTEREKELWFVNERDQYTSTGIINYLDSNQSETALIYYGNGHLIKEYINKFTNILKDDENKGYYIAYYLKKYFGEESVLIVTQIGNPANIMPKSNLDITSRFEVYVKSSVLPWQSFHPEYFDAFILRKNYMYFYQHQLNYLPCKYLLDTLINDGDSIFALNYSNSIIDLYTGKHFNSLHKLKKWYAANTDSISINNIDNHIFPSKLFKMMSGDTSVNYKHYMQGFGIHIRQLFPSPDSVTWVEKIWPEEVKHVKFINALGVYWIGYQDEKEMAKKYLQEFSGENFEEPEKYLRWYRMKYYDYDF